ncbi:hypothetical protein [uncultured Arthrobacter sp.]|uniref:hypothetical protein n=1 Tax=uncultured Arthrobacter sp. TaxID=114050 RepID=UPI003216B787
MTTPNHLPARKLETTGRGGARYVFSNHEAPEWLVRSIPGAVEAREAWLQENAKGDALAREYSASGKALVALRASDPRASELEDAERAHKDLGREVDAQAKKALAALRRFDSLAYSGLGTPEEYRAAAAEHALAKHAEAVAAWDALRAALVEREEAHKAAGSPGLDWRRSARVDFRSLASIAGVVAPILGGFDVKALERTVDGEHVPSPAERAAATLAAIKETEAKTVAAVRARGAKEGAN